VIHGYLSGLSRPEQVMYFFRDVVGEAAVSKEVLPRHTNEHQAWVEAFAAITAFIKKKLSRGDVKFRKDDNAFLSASDPRSAAGSSRPSLGLHHPEQLDYWTLILDNLEMNGDSFRLKNSRKKKDPSQ
jgi:hypothetical protein